MEKKFNLEAAKKGAVIKDGKGNEYEFIAHVPHAEETQQLIILEKTSKRIIVRLANGFFHSCDTRWSLYTEPLTVTEYAIVYFDNGRLKFYDNSCHTISEAQNIVDGNECEKDLKIIPITYEV